MVAASISPYKRRRTTRSTAHLQYQNPIFDKEEGITDIDDIIYDNLSSLLMSDYEDSKNRWKGYSTKSIISEKLLKCIL